jgi:hypothetical protein
MKPVDHAVTAARKGQDYDHNDQREERYDRKRSGGVVREGMRGSGKDNAQRGQQRVQCFFEVNH